MTTKHKLRAFLPQGDPDIGAEIECEIAFSYVGGAKPTRDDPGWSAEIEFISAAPLCNGKPAPFLDYAAHQQESLNDLAAAWLESDEGHMAALEEWAAELQEARVFIAALRRDDR